jgi:putative flippase GtrA
MKFLRFGVVGGGSVLIYAVVTWMIVSSRQADASLASGIGYLAAVPFNFVGQKVFAFRAAGEAGGQFVRYAITTVVGIGLSCGIMLASISWLGLGPISGIVLTILSLPLMTFFVLDRWVFVATHRDHWFSNAAARDRVTIKGFELLGADFQNLNAE